LLYSTFVRFDFRSDASVDRIPRRTVAPALPRWLGQTPRHAKKNPSSLGRCARRVPRRASPRRLHAPRRTRLRRTCWSYWRFLPPGHRGLGLLPLLHPREDCPELPWPPPIPDWRDGGTPPDEDARARKLGGEACPDGWPERHSSSATRTINAPASRARAASRKDARASSGSPLTSGPIVKGLSWRTSFLPRTAPRACP